jgi:hypothetical protein
MPRLASLTSQQLAGIGIIRVDPIIIPEIGIENLLHTLDNPNDYGTKENDEFGTAVAISGNYVVVGVPNEDNASYNSVGKAYIFNAANGALLHTLDNPDPATNSRFGGSISIDGNYSIIGAGGWDKAHIFDVTTGSLVHTLDNPNANTASVFDGFGNSVSIRGNYVIVGAPSEDDTGLSSGKAYIFSTSNAWANTTLEHTLDNPNAYGTSESDFFGISVAISGNYAIIGARSEDDAGGTSSGKAYIFDVTTGSLLHTLDNPNAYATSQFDQFGQSVAISGNYAIVGAYLENDAGGNDSGKAYIFDVTTGSLLHTLDNPRPYGASSAGDLFGESVAISGNYVIVGARYAYEANGSRSGKAYIFDVTTGELLYIVNNPRAPGTTQANEFGGSVAIDGSNILVGAPNVHGGPLVPGDDLGSGTAYTFEIP